MACSRIHANEECIGDQTNKLIAGACNPQASREAEPSVRPIFFVPGESLSLVKVVLYKLRGTSRVPRTQFTVQCEIILLYL